MVTVASDVTVPRALRLIPMSPLPTVSGTIDIGALPERPPPGDCWGALWCWAHQTTPATARITRRKESRKPPRERGELVRAGSSEGISIGGFNGLSMYPSSGRLRGENCVAAAYRFRYRRNIPVDSILTVLVGCCALIF